MSFKARKRFKGTKEVVEDVWNFKMSERYYTIYHRNFNEGYGNIKKTNQIKKSPFVKKNITK